MKSFVNKFVKDESGQGMVEYILIIALIVIIAIAAMRLLGQGTATKFNNVTQTIL